jgi:hypothetical protein
MVRAAHRPHRLRAETAYSGAAPAHTHFKPRARLRTAGEAPPAPIRRFQEAAAPDGRITDFVAEGGGFGDEEVLIAGRVDRFVMGHHRGHTVIDAAVFPSSLPPETRLSEPVCRRLRRGGQMHLHPTQA